MLILAYSNLDGFELSLIRTKFCLFFIFFICFFHHPSPV